MYTEWFNREQMAMSKPWYICCVDFWMPFGLIEAEWRIYASVNLPSLVQIIACLLGIIWNNSGVLLIGPLGANRNENFIDIYMFSFTKMQLKLCSGIWRPFCLGLNMLTVGSALRFPTIQVSARVKTCGTLFRKHMAHQYRHLYRNVCIYIDFDTLFHRLWAYNAVIIWLCGFWRETT